MEELLPVLVLHEVIPNNKDNIMGTKNKILYNNDPGVRMLISSPLSDYYPLVNLLNLPKYQ